MSEEANDMSTKHNSLPPDGLGPAIREEIDEIVGEPGYDDDVRAFRQAVADGSAFVGAVSTRYEIEQRLGLTGR